MQTILITVFYCNDLKNNLMTQHTDVVIKRKVQPCIGTEALYKPYGP